MITLRQKLEEWLNAVVGAAADGSLLAGAQVCGTAWDAVEQAKALMVGPIDSGSLAPDAGIEEVLDFDVKATVIIVVTVAAADEAAGPQPAEYAAAYDTAELIGKRLAQMVVDGDTTLGGRVGDCLPGKLLRTIDKVSEVPCGYANLVLRINETGQLLEG